MKKMFLSSWVYGLRTLYGTPSIKHDGSLELESSVKRRRLVDAPSAVSARTCNSWIHKPTKLIASEL